MAISTVIHTNQHSIDRVLAAGLPVILIFWQRSQPVPPALDSALDRMAEQFSGKALLAKIDADAEPGLVQRFPVTTLPGVICVKAGQVETTLGGSIGEQELRSWLSYLTGSGPRPIAAHAQSKARPEASHPVVVTDANFQQVVAGALPLLVDFWAPWCGPCRAVAPAIEQLAQEFQGRATVGKMNVDENPRTPQRFGIQGIPTLLLFKDGQVVQRLVGAQPLQVMQRALEGVVTGKE